MPKDGVAKISLYYALVTILTGRYETERYLKKVRCGKGADGRKKSTSSLYPDVYQKSPFESGLAFRKHINVLCSRSFETETEILDIVTEGFSDNIYKFICIH